MSSVPAPAPQPPTQPPLVSPSLTLPAEAIAARKKPFPEALHDLVSYCHSSHHDVLRWASDGYGFVVLDRRAFEFNILPLFFRHGKFTSLERQLANYGFKRDGRGVGAYRHEGQLFHQYFADKAKDIRLKHKTTTTTLGTKRARQETTTTVETTPAPAAASNNPSAGQAPPSLPPSPKRTKVVANSPPPPPAAASSATLASTDETANSSTPGRASLSMLAVAATWPEPTPAVAVAEDNLKPAAASLTTAATTKTYQPLWESYKPPAASSVVSSSSSSSNMPRAVVSSSSHWPLEQARQDHTKKKKRNGRRPALLPMDVPNLSRHLLVPRPALVESIVSKLLEPAGLAGNHHPQVSSFAVCVTGMAGIGKTWAVSMALRHVHLRCHFDQGICWIPFKATTTSIRTSRQLIYYYRLLWSQLRLTDPHLPPLLDVPHADHDDNDEDLELLHAQMAALLVHKRVLVVLDNVCHAQDVSWFNFGRCDEEGCPYRLLVTTRLTFLSPSLSGRRGLEWDEWSKVVMPPLTHDESLELLNKTLGRSVLRREAPVARTWMDACHGNAYLISLAGRMVGGRPPKEEEEEEEWAPPFWQANATSRQAVWCHLLEQTFCSVEHGATQRALLRLYQTLARAMGGAATTSASSSSSSGWMSFDIVRRYLEGDASSSSSSSTTVGWNQLETDKLQSLSGALWGDKVAVVLSALTTLGCLVVRTTERARGSTACKSFEYKLANPILARLATEPFQM